MVLVKQGRMVFALIGLLLANQATADESIIGLPPATRSHPELDKEDVAAYSTLLQVVERQTDVATNTRMNADYVPGIVTIFTGEELAAKGISTISEAMDLINGLRVRLTIPANSSYPSQGNAFRWKLNDGVIDTLSDKQIWAITHIPISQISRIEIIHGPTSNTHGHPAYSGLIHIVTHQAGSRLQGSAGSQLEGGASGYHSWSNPSNSFSMSLGLSGQWRGEADRDSTLPVINVQMAKASQVDAADSDPQTSRYGFFNLRINNATRLSVNHLGYKDKIDIQSPSASGTVNEKIGGEQQKSSITLDHRMNPYSDLQTDMHFGYQYHRDTSSLMNPQLLAGATNLASNNVVRRYTLEEKVTDMGIAMTLSRWDGHKVQTDLQAIYNQINWDAYGTGGTVTPSIQNRFNWSANLTDELALDSSTTLTTGLRYDHYDRGVDGTLSPSLAMVHRVNDALILKAQYIRSVRQISRDEAEDEKSQPETADTVELGAIHRTANGLGRVSIFHSWRKHLSGISSGVDDSARLLGLESGGEYVVNPRLKLEGWTDMALPIGDGVDADGILNWHGHLGSNILIQEDWHLFFGIDHQFESPSRLTSGNMTLTRNNFFRPGMKLRMNLRNLFTPSEQMNTYDASFQWRLELANTF